MSDTPPTRAGSVETFPLVKFDNHAKFGCSVLAYVGSRKLGDGARPPLVAGSLTLKVLPHHRTCYHADFGRSRSNNVSMSGKVQKIGSAFLCGPLHLKRGVPDPLRICPFPRDTSAGLTMAHMAHLRQGPKVRGP